MIRNTIKKVILWGHKLHSHTHSYIHFGFKKAFDYLGYHTEWFDDSDDVSTYDFSNSLFITEGQVDDKIPILQDCYYVLHNCDGKKYYSSVSSKNIVIIQVFTKDVFKHGAKSSKLYPFCYYGNDIIYIPWATDLLPHEINNNIKKVNNNQIKSSNIVNFVGYYLPIWDEFKNKCLEHNIKFTATGGFGRNNVDSEENMKLIQQSIIAPALQNEWQVENGYIPCRIFKNISYGKMGITNNKYVYDLFNGKIIYDNDISNIVQKGLDFEQNINKNKLLIPLMELVRDKHTYLNRIELIFWFFDNILI